MKVNVAGVELYRHVISLQDVKPSLERAIEWDIDALEKTKHSMTRLLELAKADQLAPDIGNGEFEIGLVQIAADKAEYKAFLDDINIYCHNGISNSYTANHLKRRFANGSNGLWLREGLTAIVFNDPASESARAALDLNQHFSDGEKQSIGLLHSKVKELAAIRDQVVTEVDAALDRAERRMKAGIMSERIAVNYDAVEDIQNYLCSDDIELGVIKTLPAASDFIDLFEQPHKYVSQNSQITISPDQGIVSLVIETPDTIWQGFGITNMSGMTQEESASIKAQARDYFTRQVFMDTNIPAQEAEAILRESSPSVAQNFSRSFKVVASQNAVAVMPYGDDQIETSKLVALKILEQIKYDLPDIYAKVNEHCQAISISCGAVDPRVALAYAAKEDSRAETVFGNFPISLQVRENVELYQALMEGLNRPSQKHDNDSGLSN